MTTIRFCLATVAMLAVAAAPGLSQPSTVTSLCGDGLLGAGETCKECPVDCEIRECPASDERAAFEVELHSQPGQIPVAATIRLAYRSSALRLPGSGASPELSQRITGTPSGALVSSSDFDYVVRVVLARSGGFGAKSLFSVEFDECAGAAPSTADLACVVEGCAGSGGALTGCSCSVTMQPPAPALPPAALSLPPEESTAQ